MGGSRLQKIDTKGGMNLLLLEESSACQLYVNSNYIAGTETFPFPTKNILILLVGKQRDLPVTDITKYTGELGSYFFY